MRIACADNIAAEFQAAHSPLEGSFLEGSFRELSMPALTAPFGNASAGMAANAGAAQRAVPPRRRERPEKPAALAPGCRTRPLCRSSVSGRPVEGTSGQLRLLTIHGKERGFFSTRWQYPDRRAEKLRYRALPAVPEAGEPKPNRLDQRPHRGVHDRCRRALRRLEARRAHRRGDGGQHRPCLGAGGDPARLPADARHPRQDEPREDRPFARARHRGGADPLGRAEGPSRLLPRPGDPHRQGDGCLLHRSIQ